MVASHGRSLLSVWLVLVLVGLVAGCGPSDGAGPRLKIGFVPVGTTEQYWQAVHAGASQEGAEQQVDVLWPTAFRVGDVDRQVAAIDDMLRRGAQGLAIAPVDDATLHARIDALIAAGVPTIIFDTPLGRDDLSFIGSDNHAAGRLAGEHMAKLLGGQGRVILLHTQPGAASVTARVTGFLEAIAEHPGMEIVSETPVGPGLEDAFVTSHAVLKATNAQQAGQVDGVFTPTQATTVGMARALENLKLIRETTHVGFDTSPLLANLLQRKMVDALIVQDPENMGRLGVVTLLRMINGESPEARTTTRTMVATPDNAGELEVSVLLRPNLTLVR